MKVQFLSIVLPILIVVSTLNQSFADNSTAVPNAIISESFTQQASVVRPDASVLEENNYHYLYKGKPVHLQRIKDRYMIQYNKSLSSTAPRFKQKRYFRNASYRQSKVTGNTFDIVTIDRKHVGNRTSADIASELQSEV
ncbi:MAG TPA: hypothetical protein VHO70_10315, partial [Chitinispirillaceae bacterium]|nr:hypothetical protein [Chitinispirillaceae bacterium]